jgi:hypothetical protein
MTSVDGLSRSCIHHGDAYLPAATWNPPGRDAPRSA